jgi:hypothetical protein
MKAMVAATVTVGRCDKKWGGNSTLTTMIPLTMMGIGTSSPLVMLLRRNDGGQPQTDTDNGGGWASDGWMMTTWKTATPGQEVDLVVIDQQRGLMSVRGEEVDLWWHGS